MVSVPETKKAILNLDEDVIKGLWYMTLGFIILSIHNIIAGGFLFAFINYKSISIGSFALAVFCNFLSFLRIIYIILFLMGIFKIYTLAKDISHNHFINVKIALYLMVIGISFYVFNIISYSLLFLMGFGLRFMSSFMFFSPFHLLAVMCFAAVPIFLIHDIAGRETKFILYTSFFLLIYLNILLFWHLNYRVIHIYYFDIVFEHFFRYSSLIMVLSSTGYLFFAYGYFKTMKLGDRKRNQIEGFKIEFLRNFEEINVKPEIKKCLECGKLSVEVYPDGSGYCVDCNHSYMDYRSAGNSVEG